MRLILATHENINLNLAYLLNFKFSVYTCTFCLVYVVLWSTTTNSVDGCDKVIPHFLSMEYTRGFFT